MNRSSDALPGATRDLGRRGFLRASSGLAALGAAGGLLSACSAKSAAPSTPQAVNPSKAGGTVGLLCWPGYEGNGVTQVASWKSAHGVTLNETAMSSNDQIISQLKAGGLGRYSLVTPNASYTPLLKEAGVVQPIDLSKIPNYANVLSAIARTAKSATYIDGQYYAVPYLWGQDGLVYNADKVSTPPTSWLDLLKPEYTGKVVMCGPVEPVFEVWPRVLGYNLYRMTPADVTKVVNFLTSFIKKQVKLTTNDPTAALSALASGDALVIASGVSIGYVQTAPKGDKLAFTFPKEGGGTWIDSWAIPAKAPNLDAAYAFINEMLAPPVQAQMADVMGEGVTNGQAVSSVSAANAKTFPYSSTTIGGATTPLLVYPTQTKGPYTNYTDWTSAWDQIQAASV